ncbi:hypothetical protein WICPIJ_004310 [Wickerhamomyces pijperi]|uniref:RRM domain-containing protein n=1 Tax=Wickerhamomyces pijperi TaxID=599730 RepID=A0A9P8TN15_WICPI|nr:hypothetical protein WICPIJ_004310 [Wickerhamomyces pijperi]
MSELTTVQTPSQPTLRRLFIGNISAQLAANPSELTNRLARFGQIQSEFLLKHNAVRDLHFGHVSMLINEQQFTKLKASLHGVNFKGGKLVIDFAKETFEEKWKRDDEERDNERYEKKLIRTNYEFHQKIANINKTFIDRLQVIKGRERIIPRKAIKQMTVRVTYNGRVRVLKCYKKKLWGFEKNKKLRDLVWKFGKQTWWDGNDHVVERVDFKASKGGSLHIKQDGRELHIEAVNDAASEQTGHQDQTSDEADEEKAELESNNKILASLLGSFDFDKPMQIQQDTQNAEDDEGQGSDYEFRGALNDDDEEESDFEMYNNAGKASSNGDVQYVREGEFGKANANKFSPYGEDDDDDADLDLYTNNALTTTGKSKFQQKSTEPPQAELDEGSDEDYEFIPTFGQGEPQKVELAQGTISNTETLRTLFNTNEDETGSFKLIQEDDDDIDLTATPAASASAEETAELLSANNISILTRTRQSKGLFFAHLDSPFLIAQTQLNKLNTNVDFESWADNDETKEGTFWNMRAEWGRFGRRRRRDVLRRSATAAGGAGSTSKV